MNQSYVQYLLNENWLHFDESLQVNMPNSVTFMMQVSSTLLTCLNSAGTPKESPRPKSTQAHLVEFRSSQDKQPAGHMSSCVQGDTR